MSETAAENVVAGWMGIPISAPKEELLVCHVCGGGAGRSRGFVAVGDSTLEDVEDFDLCWSCLDHMREKIRAARISSSGVLRMDRGWIDAGF
jgi:hypothetical protein